MTTAWPEVALGEVCLITMGQAPSGESYNSEGDGWPLISGAGDFHNGLPKAKKFTSVKTKLCEPGDIVLGIRASIGSKVLADKIYCLGRGVAGLRASVDLEERYLWHWLDAVAEDLAAQGRGATFKQVNKNDVAELKIPLPPLDEQRRIAAILDKADEVRSKRKAALETLETLSQAIFIEMFGDPVTNPMGWEEISFSEACPSHLGKMLDQKQQTGLSPKKYLRNANVRWLRFDLADVAEMDFSVSEEAKYRLNPGDVMICEGGEPGRAAVWRGEIEECYFQKALHRARPRPELADPDFIVHLLWLLANGGGLSDHVTSATIAHLTGEKLKRMVVPMPPIRHQQKFADEIGACERQEKRSKSALQDLDNLFSSLQQRAFEGAL